MSWFKHEREPEPEAVQYWFLPELPPLPLCPIHAEHCGSVFIDGKWLSGNGLPCEAWEAELKRHQYNQTHEYFVNPTTGDIEVHER
jgi:hypothetical protein